MLGVFAGGRDWRGVESEKAERRAMAMAAQANEERQALRAREWQVGDAGAAQRHAVGLELLRQQGRETAREEGEQATREMLDQRLGAQSSALEARLAQEKALAGEGQRLSQERIDNLEAWRAAQGERWEEHDEWRREDAADRRAMTEETRREYARAQKARAEESVARYREQKEFREAQAKERGEGRKQALRRQAWVMAMRDAENKELFDEGFRGLTDEQKESWVQARAAALVRQIEDGIGDEDGGGQESY